MPSRRFLAFWFAGLLVCAAPGIAQSPWVVPYGDPVCASNFVPTFHTAGEMPVIGNAGFRLVAENLTGRAPGHLWVSPRAGRFSLLNLGIYVDLSQGSSVFWLAGGQPGLAGAGKAVVPLPIPFEPSLAGHRLFFQGFFFDGSKPIQFTETHALEIALAGSVPPAASVLHDRLKYQAHFAGASPGQADLLGRAIWAAHQVAGYDYLRTEPFACGGESHWMVIVSHAQTGLEFCLIPGGSFRMGDIQGSGVRLGTPVRWVRLPPFLLGRTEVPQAVWERVMGFNPSHIQGPSLPVESLELSMIEDFNRRTGFRLPSEAEWEYACRAGVEACYHFGDNYSPTNPNLAATLGLYAWFEDNSSGTSHPVGQKLPNAFGLLDILGNVLEWCADSRNEGYNCAPPDGSAIERNSTYFRSGRGGGWAASPETCRSANMLSIFLRMPNMRAGLRPARGLAP